MQNHYDYLSSAQVLNSAVSQKTKDFFAPTPFPNAMQQRKMLT